jgi:hypothetical protein
MKSLIVAIGLIACFVLGWFHGKNYHGTGFKTEGAPLEGGSVSVAALTSMIEQSSNNVGKEGISITVPLPRNELSALRIDPMVDCKEAGVIKLELKGQSVCVLATIYRFDVDIREGTLKLRQQRLKLVE